MAGIRDKLIHGYMGVNLKEVWKTARIEIIDLEKKIKLILTEINE